MLFLFIIALNKRGSWISIFLISALKGMYSYSMELALWVDSSVCIQYMFS